MTINEKQIEFLARALINRLEDRGLVEFHDAHEGLELVMRALEQGLRELDEQDERA